MNWWMGGPRCPDVPSILVTSVAWPDSLPMVHTTENLFQRKFLFPQIQFVVDLVPFCSLRNFFNLNHQYSIYYFVLTDGTIYHDNVYHLEAVGQSGYARNVPWT